MTNPSPSPEARDDPLPWRRRDARDTREFLTPAVRRAAADRGLDPRALTGSGASGRVTLGDVRAHEVQLHEELPAADQVVPFNNVRRRAATALLASKRTAPHALAVMTVDYTRIERARAGTGVTAPRVTALPFIARVAIDALREFPRLNATVDGEGVVVHHGVNLGIAVDLDFQGLVVPVVRGADGMRLRGLAASIRDLATRARSKRLGPDDLAGGTFTITNPGAAGTWISVPVLNAPQVGILSTDGVSKRVVVADDGALRIAPVGNLCLTFDHRVIDGAYAGAFLGRLREIVEHRDWSAEL